MSNHLVMDGGTGSAPDVDGAAGTVKPRGFVMWEKDFTWCIKMNEDKKTKTSVKRKITWPTSLQPIVSHLMTKS